MKYKLSFSAGSLLISESIRIADLYLEHGDWDKVSEITLQDNVIQKVRSASVKRMMREIKHRLSTLTPEQLQLLVHADSQDQAGLLYLGACKYYRFLRDFVVEVVRNKTLMFDNMLTVADYDRFVDGKMFDHPELSELTETSAAKLRQVTWRIMAEANILESTRSGIITPILMSPALLDVVMSDAHEWLKIFLMSDADINRQELAHAS